MPSQTRARARPVTYRRGGMMKKGCRVLAGDVATSLIEMSKSAPNVVQNGRTNARSFTSWIGLP